LAGKTKQGATSIVSFGWHISKKTTFIDNAALSCRFEKKRRHKNIPPSKKQTS
jgi:hypothetical protein